jgi:hypothetical protein
MAMMTQPVADVPRFPIAQTQYELLADVLRASCGLLPDSTPTADALARRNVAAIIQHQADRAGKGATTPPQVLATLIMEPPMTDEVGADDSPVSRRDELKDELVRAVLDLLAALDASDAVLEEHPRHAVHRSQIDLFNFVIRAGQLRRDLGIASPNSHLPGDAVARLVMAIATTNQGVRDPVLEPIASPGTRRGGHTVILADRLNRVETAIAMELLMMAGYGVKEAADEVAKILKDHPILAGVAGDPAGVIIRWRADIKASGADSWETEKLDELVAAAKSTVESQGGTSADFVKVVRNTLPQRVSPPAQQ